MNQFEKDLQHKLQNEQVPDPNPELLWSRIQEKRFRRKRSENVRLIRRMVVTVSAFLVIVVIGGAYSNEIAHAASSLFNQVFGSVEEVKQLDPHADEQVVEKDLKIAKEVLTESEFRKYTALIKEQTNMMKKAIQVVDGEQKVYIDRLTKEEKEKLNQNETQLRPLMNKIDQHFVYNVDEAAKKLHFPVKHPNYVPAGYTLKKEEAKAAGTPEPIVSFTYKQTDGEFGFTIRQSAILTEEYDEYSKRVGNWAHDESYYLDGNQVKFTREGKNVSMMKMIVPKKGISRSYQIFIIADILSKEDVEKIALSMVAK
ncbi:hypothetical protein HQN89_26960 [Paenibacillus frigoriresistens]|uniref:hypothetical protein n=1 Tax=Paenibacillus alginolyticus TaxID=59839 RepID=UPI00156701E9|nr:hypothetical protein [Paenibacillus frigoriresistens]NRF94550.1 hypothetical protein [Paenibacillus frigoriresistens]